MPLPSGSDVPTVSVLMVAHNAGKYLAPAVASILGQTFAAFELVLFDNASTDRSVDALESGATDARVRVHREQKNLGQQGGWRAGLPLCRGEFLALTDADDLWLPRRLEAQLGFLRTNPAIDLGTTLSEEIDADGATVGPAFSVHAEDDIRAFAEFDMPVPLHTAMMRTTFARRVGFTAESSWACDYDFLVRALEAGRVACLREVHYLYRVHRISFTSTGRNRQALAAGFVSFRAAGRRRGQPVDAALAATQRHWLDEGPELRVAHAVCLREALRLRLPALAVFHARRARLPLQVGRALAVAANAEPRRFGFICRLALLGPIRGLRIIALSRPVPGSRAGVPAIAGRLPADFPA